MNIDRIRELTFTIPILMTEDDGQYMIMSKELAIFIQDSTEDKAKKLFEKSLSMLLNRWVDEDRMIDQMKLHGFLTQDIDLYKRIPQTKPRYSMPNLELGKHSKVEVAYG